MDVRVTVSAAEAMRSANAPAASLFAKREWLGDFVRANERAGERGKTSKGRRTPLEETFDQTRLFISVSISLSSSS